MALAMGIAARVRTTASPNPWVGAALIADGAVIALGATEAPGGRHAEIVALESAGSRAQDSTLVVTLEPCAHQGRTGPCVEAIKAAGVARVVVGTLDPDPRVSGRGIAALREAGIEVEEACAEDEVKEQLAAYLHHRSTGRPLVVLKLAATLDGQTAMADGSSRWITSPEAREDVHQRRARADAILVGAGTVRADDPELTVRLEGFEGRQPRRIVLGDIAESAKMHPCEVHHGDIGVLLDRLGSEGVLELLVEGGARVAYALHRDHLVNRYLLYLAPAFAGGVGGAPLFDGPGAISMSELWRGCFASVVLLGGDLCVEVVA